MTPEEMWLAPLDQYNTTLADIVGAWAEEFTGKPDEAKAIVKAGFIRLIANEQLEKKT